MAAGSSGDVCLAPQNCRQESGGDLIARIEVAVDNGRHDIAVGMMATESNGAVVLGTVRTPAGSRRPDCGSETAHFILASAPQSLNRNPPESDQRKEL
jgi:hypothetical protein